MTVLKELLIKNNSLLKFKFNNEIKINAKFKESIYPKNILTLCKYFIIKLTIKIISKLII